MDKKNWFVTKILGVKVEFPSLEQAVVWVEERVKYNKKGQIVTPNPEHVVLAQKDKEFFRVLNNADLTICDGIGLVWAAKLLGAAHDAFLVSSPRDSVSRNVHKVTGPIANMSKNGHFASPKLNLKRVSGTDLMIALSQKAAQKGWRVFLLGGEAGLAGKAAKQLTINNQLFNHLTIKSSSGAKDIRKEIPHEQKRVIKEINSFRPHLLFVAYGAPYQEKWIAKNLPKLKINVAMGVGGAFDYLSGKVSRAPKWISSLGLEWLWRLFCQPWRIKRQLRLIEFVWLNIKKFYSS